MKSTDGKTAFVNDEKNVKSFSVTHADTETEHMVDVYTALPDEIVQKVFLFNGSVQVAILADDKFVVRQVVDGKLQVEAIHLELG